MIISTMQNKLKKPLFSLLSVVFWVGVWYFAATLANRNLLLKIPLPLSTLKAFCESVTLPRFWAAVGTSLLHIVSGFLSAVILGVLVGMLNGNSRFFKTLSAPVLHLIRSVPVAAFIFLAWLWVPNSVLPAFISFLTVFPIVCSHIEAGLSSVDNRLTEMAAVMGLSRMGIIKNIKLPTVLPFLRTSMITGLGFAWKSGVAAEVICNPTGSIGALLSSAKLTIDYNEVFAVTLTIVLLSLLLENIIKLVWREKCYE